MITEKMIDELRLGTFDNDDWLLKPKDVAAMLGFSVSTVYKMARRKQLPSVRWKAYADGTTRVRYTTRFKKSEILDFIKAGG